MMISHNLTTKKLTRIQQREIDIIIGELKIPFYDALTIFSAKLGTHFRNLQEIPQKEFLNCKRWLKAANIIYRDGRRRVDFTTVKFLV